MGSLTTLREFGDLSINWSAKQEKASPVTIKSVRSSFHSPARGWWPQAGVVGVCRVFHTLVGITHRYPTFRPDPSGLNMGLKLSRLLCRLFGLARLFAEKLCFSVGLYKDFRGYAAGNRVAVE